MVHPEGWRFVGIFGGITLFLYLFSSFFGILGLLLTAWCLYFFRDPKRIVPQDENLILSPADGKVVFAKQVIPPQELGLGDELVYRISIFLNVFNVHINRTPVKGKIERIIYYPGKFFNASLDKASEHNERNAVIIETSQGLKIGVVQIAGLVARRIVSFITQSEEVKAGQRFGLIRFGSRADIYLPKGIIPVVIEGQIAIGGETVLARFNETQKNIEGLED
jgi:phosphatidylserine decarboxylase